jgi:hypothetical protein
MSTSKNIKVINPIHVNRLTIEMSYLSRFINVSVKLFQNIFTRRKFD